MITKKEAIKLDKYYTKVEIAKQCVDIYLRYVDNDVVFIEPSAGSGSFLEATDLPVIGYDILPEHPSVTKLDFIKEKLPIEIQPNMVAIGNPPFGKRAKLAIQFVNKCLDYFGMVGFIVPNQFNKWSVQNHINPYAKLIHNESLPENAFTLVGKDYDIRCSFQVWSLRHDGEDLRIKEKPKTTHPDFEMWQYNRTKEAEKYFNFEWDFAVPRQGFNDYSFKAFSKEDCDRKKQWIFFKANSKEVLEKLMNINFEKLSKKNSGIPGFGKADVIEVYEATNGK